MPEVSNSIVGDWDVTVQTPFGEQVVTLKFTDERSGTGQYGTESIALSNVTSSAGNATWTVALTQPLKVTLKCSVVIDGGTMSGTASAGFFGKFGLSGSRAAT